tara:strand:+ start:551 stop:1285 length:735 start_codon:yes stop_codon:yes gene_type:complete
MIKGKKKTVKSKKNKTKLYFNKETEDAIVSYCITECQRKREDLYRDFIKKSFEKLAENLIFIHGFHSETLPYDVLKNDCVSFLFQTMHKFDPSKGSKAFSYFNVVAKHWLIAHSKKDQKRKNMSVSIDNFHNLSARDRSAIELYGKINSPEKEMIIQETTEDLKKIFEIISKRITAENEILCMNAIVQVFENVEHLDFLNKRAIFVYLREISGLNPKQLSIAMSNIRKHFKEIIKSDKYSLIFR